MYVGDMYITIIGFALIGSFSDSYRFLGRVRSQVISLIISINITIEERLQLFGLGFY